MDVLIVDDADVVRPRLATVLSGIGGLDVSCCAPRSGGVIELPWEKQPDVIVIDIRMYGGALDLVRAIKSSNHPPVAIALLSSSAIQYRAACHRAGAERLFHKVCDQERLVEAFAELQKEPAC